MKKNILLSFAFIGLFICKIDGAQLPNNMSRSQDAAIAFKRHQNFYQQIVKPHVARRTDLADGFDILKNRGYIMPGQGAPSFVKFMQIRYESSEDVHFHIEQAESMIACFLVPSFIAKINNKIERYQDVHEITDQESAYVMKHRHGFLQSKLKQALESKDDRIWVKDNGNNYLHVAAESNLPKLAQLCFDVNVDFESTNNYGQTPFSCAVRVRNLNMQRMLLSQDHNFQAKLKVLRTMR